MRDRPLPNGGPAAVPPQLRVPLRVRLAGAPRPEPAAAVQQRALLLERAVERDRLGVLGLDRVFAALPRPSSLPRLAMPEQLRHLIGFEDARNADEVVLLIAAGLGQ